METSLCYNPMCSRKVLADILHESEASMNRDLPRHAQQYRWLIFWILSVGYLLVFFHRLCPAVVAADMMRELHTSGALIGFLGSAYFYPYALMQIPTGLLSDSWGPRRTISLFLIIASAGSILLGMAPSPAWAIIGRVLVGLGVSTLFVCTLKVLSQWFHAREFASMTGIFMAMGGLGSLLATGPLAYLSNRIGWRTSFLMVGGITLLVALLIWLFVRDTPADFCVIKSEQHPAASPAALSLSKGIRTVLTEPAFWPIAIWFFFNSAIYFSFIGLWGGPYLLHVYAVSKAEAGKILSLSAIGLMVGSPLVSLLSNRVFRARKPVLILSSIIALCMTAPLAFATASIPLPALYLICLGLGATTGASVVIAFTAVKEMYPLQISGTATGLVNLFPFAGGAVFQPILGIVLERNGRLADNFTTTGYMNAFFTLFLCAALACGCSYFMRETFVDEGTGK
jgi:sugar phosphate permease